MGQMCRHFTESEAEKVKAYLDWRGFDYTVERLKASIHQKLPISITIKATVEEQQMLNNVFIEMRERPR